MHNYNMYKGNQALKVLLKSPDKFRSSAQHVKPLRVRLLLLVMFHNDLQSYRKLTQLFNPLHMDIKHVTS